MDESRWIFSQIFRRLVADGRFVSPRGQLVLEVENFSYVLPPYVRFQNFKCRKLNIDYIKDETMWYICGDRFDVSIAKKAKIWQDIINKDGSINSNYGQYIFAGPVQFDRVINTLIDDRDSRRASMMILSADHLSSDTKDVPCTYALNFRIRANRLNMSVHMRSQDAVYGMGNDAPAFSFIHEMVLNALRAHYSTLEYGNYFHIADSFHVYSKHFDMIEKISGWSIEHKIPIKDWKPEPFIEVNCPRISGPDEVSFIRKLDFSSIPEDFQFSRWLSKQ